MWTLLSKLKTKDQNDILLTIEGPNKLLTHNEM